MTKEAKERQGTRTDLDISQKFDKSSDGNKRTDEAIADKIGVSRQTYRDMKLVTNEGTPEQVERMDKGGKGNSR